MNEFLSKNLPLLISSFAVALLLGYFSRKARSATDDGQLVLGPEFKIMGWFGMAIAVGTLIVMFTVDHEEQYVSLTIIAAMSGLLSAVVLMLGYGTRGYFDDEQITVFSFWRSPRTGKWTDLQKAVFKKNGQTFEFTFKDGTKIGLSKLTHGHKSVCDHVETLGFDIKDRPKG